MTTRPAPRRRPPHLPMQRRLVPSLALVLLAASAEFAPARADDPKFVYAKKDDLKEVIWKASAQLGVLGAYGNAQSFTISGGLSVSRNDGWNKVGLDVGGAFAQAWNRRLAIALNSVGAIDQASLDVAAGRGDPVPTVSNWMARMRYDRFFTPMDSLYLAAFIGGDMIAGKPLLAGGQIGYSRLLVKNEMHELALEAGYDLTYFRLPDDPRMPTVDPIHSGRFFLGYLLTVRKETAINASVEAIINGNTVVVGDDAASKKGFAEASRIVGKVGLNTLIYKMVSFKFGITAKFDNAPAILPFTLPKDTAGNPVAIPTNLVKTRAEKLDLIADAAIVVSFL